MIHDGVLPDYGKVFLNCKPIYDYIKYKKHPVTPVKIEELIHKELHSIDKASLRYKAADTDYPILVVDYTDHLRVIDGRHRIAKTLERGHSKIDCYVIDSTILDKFI